MIKHIVMWKLREQALGKTKRENAWTIQRELEKLPVLIPEIRHLETGIPAEKSDDGCDIVLCAEFDSRDDLRAYLSHPAHLKTGELISRLREERYAVDYEI